LQDCGAEEVLAGAGAVVGDDLEADGGGAGGVAPESYSVRGAAEGADVGVDPLEGEALVQKAEVEGAGGYRCCSGCGGGWLDIECI
jgi:hypothetical protein